jgi:putative redox protein
MTSAVDERGAEASSKFWILLTASLVSSLIMLDSNIVAVSLPVIGRSLGASFAGVQWMISAYVLTYAALLLLASGNYADPDPAKRDVTLAIRKDGSHAECERPKRAQPTSCGRGRHGRRRRSQRPRGRLAVCRWRPGWPRRHSSRANPYELLSASLAACTAMTIRLQARRRRFPLSHVEVAVSYRHGDEGGRDAFERAITLEGDLDDEQRAQLMLAANMCPVGRTLGLSADIRTNDSVTAGRTTLAPASYDDDLSELPIPNIDPD